MKRLQMYNLEETVDNYINNNRKMKIIFAIINSSLSYNLILIQMIIINQVDTECVSTYFEAIYLLIVLCN